MTDRDATAHDAEVPHLRSRRTEMGTTGRSLARPILQLDLRAEAEALRREDGWNHAGHSAKTLVKHATVRIVLIAMKKGNRMTEHRASGAISIQPIDGRLRLDIEGETFEVPAGDLLVVDAGLSHDVEALEDTAFVLSVHSAS